MKIVWIAGTVFLLAGLGMLYGGFALWRSNAEFVAHAVGADGTVTELAYSSSSKGSGTYRPVVEFKAATGQQSPGHPSRRLCRPTLMPMSGRAYHAIQAAQVVD